MFYNNHLTGGILTLAGFVIDNWSPLSGALNTFENFGIILSNDSILAYVNFVRKYDWQS